MDKKDRLQKLSAGMSVKDAVAAWAAKRDVAEELDLVQALREELEGVIEVMYLMACVDGNVSDEEMSHLNASLQALIDIQGDGSFDLNTTIQSLAQSLSDEGWKRRLEAAAAKLRTEEVRSFAFQLAAGVAFADDFVAHAEAAAIDSLKTALSLSDAEVEALLAEVHERLS